MKGKHEKGVVLFGAPKKADTAGTPEAVPVVVGIPVSETERRLNMKKEDIIRKLTSRKLWVAIAAFVSGLILAFGGNESTASTVSGVILQGAAVIGYLFAEGLTDAARNEREE